MSLRPEGSDRVMCCLKPDKNDSEDRQGSPRPHKGSSTTTYNTTRSPGERLRRRAEGETHTKEGNPGQLSSAGHAQGPSQLLFFSSPETSAAHLGKAIERRDEGAPQALLGEGQRGRWKGNQTQPEHVPVLGRRHRSSGNKQGRRNKLVQSSSAGQSEAPSYQDR